MQLDQSTDTADDATKALTCILLSDGALTYIITIIIITHY